MKIQRRSLAALVGVTFVTAACTGDAPTLQAPEPVHSRIACSGVVAYFEVNPETLLLRVGESASVSAWAYDTTGCLGLSGMVDWSSDNAAVATVSPSQTWGSTGHWHSTVTGVASGTAIVQGRIENETDVSHVTVYQPVLTSITVSPGWASVFVGASTSFSATGYDQHGRVCQNFCGAPAPTWSVDHPDIASISSSGMATGLEAGGTTVRATSTTSGTIYQSLSGPISGSAALQVQGSGCEPMLICD